jgi:hypothetical protein
MAIARRPRHRRWLSLVAIAWAMLATVDAFARESGGNGGRAVAGGITRETAPGRTGADCAASGARAERDFRLGVHKQRLAIPKFRRSNDPNDEGTSRDPGDDETSDDLDDDDEKHHAVSGSLQDAGCCWILLQAEFAPAWTEFRSAPSLSQHPLRC